MSTLTTTRPDAASAPDAANRGHLVIAAKVIEKIASQAASEVTVAGGTSGGLLGIGARADSSARPKVEVELAGRRATVEVAVALAYPTPIRGAADRVRSHVVERVGALTGVEVTRVDVNVTALGFAPRPDREALR